MRGSALAVGLLAAGLAALPALAQRSTEQFIPIGRSPGLSAAETTIGRVEVVDRTARTLVLAGREIAVPHSARIWLDRSALGQSNVSGSLDDCVPGRIVEALLEATEERPTARWIKVQIRGATP